MNFLFWNIKKKTSDDFMMHVVNLLNENSIDIFMVAELPQDNIQYFERYIIDKTDGKYKLINGFLNIISEINGDSMLKEDGTINGDRFSDHLPLTFSVNI